ncbi:MAG: hypothetical protein LBS86_07765 [Treponema sp.]|jgi:hypothetical protein|nr:hypothetical protein [Treponema sp.]
MQFTNGCRLMRNDIEPHFAAQSRVAEQKGDDPTVYAPDHPIVLRGATPDEALLTICCANPMKNAVSACLTPFELTPEPAFQPEICVSDRSATLKSGDLAVCAERKRQPFALDTSGRNAYTSV